jgi:hypothetical protein
LRVFVGEKARKATCQQLIGICFNYLRPRQLFEAVHFDNEFQDDVRLDAV